MSAARNFGFVFEVSDETAAADWLRPEHRVDGNTRSIDKVRCVIVIECRNLWSGPAFLGALVRELPC